MPEPNNNQRPKPVNNNVAKRLAHQLDAQKKLLYSWPSSEEPNPTHIGWVQIFGRQ